jgi:pimeloyl-ACP methyl ester carboxylesterase
MDTNPIRGASHDQPLKPVTGTGSSGHRVDVRPRAFVDAGQQRARLSATAFEEPAAAAARRTKPSWAILPTQDGAIDPDVHRFAYERAGARTTEVSGASHAVMVSQHGLVARVISEALSAVPTAA